jgi:hypothetical protein
MLPLATSHSASSVSSAKDIRRRPAVVSCIVNSKLLEGGEPAKLLTRTPYARYCSSAACPGRSASRNASRPTISPNLTGHGESSLAGPQTSRILSAVLGARKGRTWLAIG